MNTLKRIILSREAGLALLLAAIIGGFGSTVEYFLDPFNVFDRSRSWIEIGMIAVPMTLIITTGGIDLSVGAVLALSGSVMGICLNRWGLPVPLAMTACVMVGLLCGSINGSITVWRNIPSFIVTLGMMEAARGAAYLVSKSQTQYFGGTLDFLSAPIVAGLSLSFLLAVLSVIVGQVFLSTTRHGRYILAIGANEESARLSGIPTRRIRFTVFAAAGCLSAMAAPMYCTRLSAANPNDGLGYELQAIAAVVIGGTSLMGGRGSVLNTFLGVLIIKVLETGLYQIGAQLPTHRLVTGVVIVAAVIIDVYRRRLASGRRGVTASAS